MQYKEAQYLQTCTKVCQNLLITGTRLQNCGGAISCLLTARGLILFTFGTIFLLKSGYILIKKTDRNDTTTLLTRHTILFEKKSWENVFLCCV